MKEKRGHVPSSFHREDIGRIAPVWGDESGGICHLIKQGERQGIDADDFLSDITDVVESVNIKFNQTTGHFEI
jgi:hypothetical protein